MTDNLRLCAIASASVAGLLALGVALLKILVLAVVFEGLNGPVGFFADGDAAEKLDVFDNEFNGEPNLGGILDMLN